MFWSFNARRKKTVLLCSSQRSSNYCVHRGSFTQSVMTDHDCLYHFVNTMGQSAKTLVLNYYIHTCQVITLPFQLLPKNLNIKEKKMESQRLLASFKYLLNILFCHLEKIKWRSGLLQQRYTYVYKYLPPLSNFNYLSPSKFL